MLSRDLRFLGDILSTYGNYRQRSAVCSSRPTIFWIETTNACNLRCPMCPTTYYKGRKGHMDLDLFKQIIDEIKDYVLESYIMLGGEPLLHRRLPEMIAYMAQNRVGSIMHTNGTLLTEEWSRRLIEAGLSYISFSVDGYDKATYEQIRVSADFEDTIANLVGFLRIKQARKARRPYVRIQCIVNPCSDDRFSGERREAFVKRFRGLPVDDFDTVGVTNMARDLPTTVYAIEKPKTVAEYERLGFRYHPCHRLWSTLTILWDGTVVPCCFDFHGKLPLGNVREKRLLEIWNAKPMQDLRTLHAQKTIDDVPLCSTCNIPFSPTLLGLPIHFAGHQSLLRKYLGARLYGKIGSRLRFRGLDVAD